MIGRSAVYAADTPKRRGACDGSAAAHHRWSSAGRSQWAGNKAISPVEHGVGCVPEFKKVGEVIVVIHLLKFCFCIPQVQSQQCLPQASFTI